MPGVMPRRFAPQLGGNQRKLGVPPPIRRSVVGSGFGAVEVGWDG